MQIEVITPYSFCAKCPHLRVVATVDLNCADDDFQIVHECANAEICKWIVEDRGE